jgi:hypothetical protein
MEQWMDGPPILRRDTILKTLIFFRSFLLLVFRGFIFTGADLFLLRARAKNKFTFLRVEAPAWQGAKAPAFRDMSSFRNPARQDASAFKNVKLLLREPLISVETN